MQMNRFEINWKKKGAELSGPGYDDVAQFSVLFSASKNESDFFRVLEKEWLKKRQKFCTVSCCLVLEAIG